MRPQRVRLIVLSGCVALCLLLLLERSFLPGISERPLHKGFDLLRSVVRLVMNDYIEEREPTSTMEGAFKGLVDSLDPASSYLNREMTAKYIQRNSRWADIGIVLFKGDYGLFPQVVGVDENSPAEKAGLKPGDTVSAMDEAGTLNMSSLETNLYLKDLEQKSIALKILRENTTLELKMEREVLYPDPFVFKPAGRFAVLKLINLYPPCVEGIRKTILPLVKSQKNPLVLDLRNCHEGEIDEARDFLNLFIKTSLAGYIEKKDGTKDIFACPLESDIGSAPAAVWVNQGTMGPAELVAAVLQEARKVKIIGTATPGLVCRQDLFPLQDGSSVLLTSGIFSLASGKKIWEEGVTPDEKIDSKDQSTGVYLTKTEALSVGR